MRRLWDADILIVSQVGTLKTVLSFTWYFSYFLQTCGTGSSASIPSANISP